MGSKCIGLVGMLLLSACSSSYLTTSQGTEGSVSFSELNTLATGSKCTIVLKDGQIIDGIDLTVRADSTRWGEISTSSIKSILTDSLQSVELHYHTWSAIKGFGYGAALGVVVGGVVVGPGAVSRAPKGFELAAWLSYTAGGAAIGAVLGSVIYGLIGDKEEYVIILK